ncbi:MAG TPA: hypothetical protein VM577_04390 [Anaerovoracaceae bacterium]|nr:hypothetical protein [Anaerovoracaceae bacterium]
MSKNINDNVRRIVDRIDRRKLRNNTQRVLLALLTSNEEWVSRTALRVPSVGARLRDLRKERFGGFQVQCHTATELKRQHATRSTNRPTFYRLNPRTVTLHRVMKAFEGVITNSK